MRLNARNRDLLLIGSALLAVLLYVVVAGGGFPLDDSWIHQVYGRNLASYQQWAFIPGQPSAASTAPLYTLLLALGYALHLPYMLYTHVLGALVLAGLALVAARLTLRFAPDRMGWSLVAGLAVIFTWHHVWAAASGMETIIFMFWTLWLFLWVMIEQQSNDASVGRSILFGVSIGLATLTRPEGILLGGLCGLALVLARPRGWMAMVRFGGVAILACGLVLMPYLLLNLQLTGGLLPDTASAKFEQHSVLLAQPLLTRLGDLSIAILAGGQFLLLAGVVIYIGLVLSRRKSAIWLLPLVWSGALILLYALRLPAAYQHGRYVMPALPALVWCGVMGLSWALAASRYQLLPRVISRVFALASVLTVLFFFVGPGLLAYQNDVAVINEEMVQSARWIRDHLPADELLALHDIGAVGYFAPRPELLDVAGLITPAIVPAIGNPAALWQFMQAQDARYFFGFPNQIPGGSTDDPRLCLLYTTNGPTSQQLGAGNMSVYRIAWDEICDNKDEQALSKETESWLVSSKS